MIVIIAILGVLLGLGTAWICLFATARSSTILWPVAAVFGGLGAVSGNQLLSWGPALGSMYILPVVTGGIVMAFVSVCGFYIVRNYFKVLRKKD